MSIDGSSRARSTWWMWLVGAVGVGAAILLLAWVTGAFTPAAAESGTCYVYQELAQAGSAPPVSCDQPHSAQAVGFFEPSLDSADLRKHCRVVAAEWLDADSRASKASPAFRGILVDVQAPWRRSGVRCDVVRVEFTGVGNAWVPAVVTGSAQGAVATAPRTWAQCRRLASSESGASIGCKSSGKRVVEFPFTVTTKGKYRRDQADVAALKACQAAANPEVQAGATPVLVSAIKKRVWEAGSQAAGRCTYKTKTWSLVAG